MLLLVLGLVLFIASHSLAFAAPGLRTTLIARLGPLGFRGVYSVVAGIGLVLIVKGFAAARYDGIVLYTSPEWLKQVTLVLMLGVFPLLFAANGKGYIRATLKHPMLAGVKLWAFAHLLANGRLADLVLFGALLAWAVIDRLSFRRRPDAAPWSGGPKLVYDVVAVVAGLAVYGFLVAGWHLKLFGVSPMG